MPKSRVSLSVLLLLASACGLVTEPRDSNGLSAQRDGSTLHLKNQGERPIYFFAVEQSTAARILWAACDDPERCNRVAPKAEKGLPLDSIWGYKPVVLA